MPAIVHSTPTATLTQNTVERSRSVIRARWTRAAPRDRSEKMKTRLEKTRTSAARPYSSGVSRRASTMPTTTRDPCFTRIERIFHANPWTTAPRRPRAPAAASSAPAS
jgi:hypothetical protein